MNTYQMYGYRAIDKNGKQIATGVIKARNHRDARIKLEKLYNNSELHYDVVLF
jgi:transposase-like protein